MKDFVSQVFLFSCSAFLERSHFLLAMADRSCTCTVPLSHPVVPFAWLWDGPARELSQFKTKKVQNPPFLVFLSVRLFLFQVSSLIHISASCRDGERVTRGGNTGATKALLLKQMLVQLEATPRPREALFCPALSHEDLKVSLGCRSEQDICVWLGVCVQGDSLCLQCLVTG